jgi:hypothetical protein
LEKQALVRRLLPLFRNRASSFSPSDGSSPHPALFAAFFVRGDSEYAVRSRRRIGEPPENGEVQLVEHAINHYCNRKGPQQYISESYAQSQTVQMCKKIGYQ